MGGFTNQVQGLLDRLYNFVGGERPSSFLNTSADIQRVHDVSRDVQLSALSNQQQQALTPTTEPYFNIVRSHAHTDIDVIRSALGVYKNQSATWALSSWVPPDPLKETVWILGCSAHSNIMNGLVQVEVYGQAFGVKAGAGSGSTPTVLIMRANGQASNADVGGKFHATSSLVGVPSYLPYFPFPVANKLLNNGPLEVVSQSGVTCTIDIMIACIRLPIGVTPPGLR